MNPEQSEKLPARVTIKARDQLIRKQERNKPTTLKHTNKTPPLVPYSVPETNVLHLRRLTTKEPNCNRKAGHIGNTMTGSPPTYRAFRANLSGREIGERDIVERDIRERDIRETVATC